MHTAGGRTWDRILQLSMTCMLRRVTARTLNAEMPVFQIMRSTLRWARLLDPPFKRRIACILLAKRIVGRGLARVTKNKEVSCPLTHQPPLSTIHHVTYSLFVARLRLHTATSWHVDTTISRYFRQFLLIGNERMPRFIGFLICLAFTGLIFTTSKLNLVGRVDEKGAQSPTIKTSTIEKNTETDVGDSGGIQVPTFVDDKTSHTTKRRMRPLLVALREPDRQRIPTTTIQMPHNFGSAPKHLFLSAVILISNRIIHAAVITTMNSVRRWYLSLPHYHNRWVVGPSRLPQTKASLSWETRTLDKWS